MTKVWVKNSSDEGFKHMFAGVEYDFPAGKTVEVEKDAASHIFGYEMPDRLFVLARLGWAPTARDVQRGFERLDKFEISRDPPVAEEPKLRRVK